MRGCGSAVDRTRCERSLFAGRFSALRSLLVCVWIPAARLSFTSAHHHPTTIVLRSAGCTLPVYAGSTVTVLRYLRSLHGLYTPAVLARTTFAPFTACVHLLVAFASVISTTPAHARNIHVTTVVAHLHTSYTFHRTAGFILTRHTFCGLHFRYSFTT